MTRKSFILLPAFLVIIFLVVSCNTSDQTKNKQTDSLIIKDIKMARNIDEKMQPSNITLEFNSGDSVIYNWFYYENAQPGTKLEVVWFYERDEIISYSVDVNGNGIRHDKLRMPDGNLFPAGKYMVEIYHQNKAIKNIFFSVVQ